jgi:hypothetical protein
MQRLFPEEVRVGTFDWVTNRWTKRVVTRYVLEQRWHSDFQAEQGSVTYHQEQVAVYRRAEQRYWTMFLDEVI